jgi:hypothetical protein
MWGVLIGAAIAFFLLNKQQSQSVQGPMFNAVKNFALPFQTGRTAVDGTLSMNDPAAIYDASPNALQSVNTDLFQPSQIVTQTPGSQGTPGSPCRQTVLNGLTSYIVPGPGVVPTPTTSTYNPSTGGYSFGAVPGGSSAPASGSGVQSPYAFDPNFSYTR